jgi:hypothetical protein
MPLLLRGIVLWAGSPQTARSCRDKVNLIGLAGGQAARDEDLIDKLQLLGVMMNAGELPSLWIYHT